jgi:hypothetical protein
VDVRINHFRMICAARCSNPRRLEYFVFGVNTRHGAVNEARRYSRRRGTHPLILAFFSYFLKSAAPIKREGRPA